MIPGFDESIELCRRIERGDESELELFARHCDRLKRMDSRSTSRATEAPGKSLRGSMPVRTRVTLAW
jgi:hypothetical protein